MLHDKYVLRALNKIRRKGMTVDEGLRFIVADQSCSFSEKQTARAILNDPEAFDEFLKYDGGPGSGNFGHGGRPGQVGGSSGKGGSGSLTSGMTQKNTETAAQFHKAVRFIEKKIDKKPAGTVVQCQYPNDPFMRKSVFVKEADGTWTQHAYAGRIPLGRVYGWTSYMVGTELVNHVQDSSSSLTTDGGPGSGNFGHKGRPGQRGGSGGGGTSKAPKGLSFEQQKARWGAMTPKQYSETKLAEFPDGVNPEVRAVYEKAAKAEPAITAAMQKHAQECGAEMDGLEFRMKDGDSYMRKVRKDAQEHGHQGQLKAAGKLYDVVRYTQVSDEKNLVQNAKKTLTNLQAEGYNVVGVKNTWNDPNNPYNGVNVKLRSPDGQQFELQFHTRDSLRVKEQIHKLYEEQRKLSKRDPRYKELDAQMRAISSVLMPLKPCKGGIEDGRSKVSDLLHARWASVSPCASERIY